MLPLPPGRSPLWAYDARRRCNLPSPRSTSSCPSASPMAQGTCRRTRPSAISCVAGAAFLRVARCRISPPVRLSNDAGLLPRPPPSHVPHNARHRPRPSASPMARDTHPSATPFRLSCGSRLLLLDVWNNATEWSCHAFITYLIGLCIFNDSSLEPYDLSDDDTDLQKHFTHLSDLAAALRKPDDRDGVKSALSSVENFVRAPPDELCHCLGDLVQALVHVRCSDVVMEGEEHSAEEKREDSSRLAGATCCHNAAKRWCMDAYFNSHEYL